MSNAPEGRTYISYSWEERADYGPTHRYTDRDYVRMETPHVIPNGKWVLERPLQGTAYSWLVGATSAEVDELLYTDEVDSRRVLHFSDKPFGFIVAEEEDMDMSAMPRVVKPTGRKTLVCARQIHKGELGHTVHILRPDYVRQAALPNKAARVRHARDARRGQLGWVRLSELGEAAVTGYDADRMIDLVLGYWQFSQHVYYENFGVAGVLVDVALGLSWHIEGVLPEVVSTTPEKFRRLAKDATEMVWIPRGFAFTILRLQALGVQPSILQTA